MPSSIMHQRAEWMVEGGGLDPTFPSFTAYSTRLLPSLPYFLHAFLSLLPSFLTCPSIPLSSFLETPLLKFHPRPFPLPPASPFSCSSFIFSISPSLHITIYSRVCIYSTLLASVPPILPFHNAIYSFSVFLHCFSTSETGFLVFRSHYFFFSSFLLPSLPLC